MHIVCNTDCRSANGLDRKRTCSTKRDFISSQHELAREKQEIGLAFDPTPQNWQCIADRLIHFESVCIINFHCKNLVQMQHGR